MSGAGESPRETWAKAEARAKRTALEDHFAQQVSALGLPKPVREYRFDASRRWRFDFAWPGFAIAVELDGGTHSGGRHVRGDGFERDVEKMNAATAAGWRVYRYTSGRVRSGFAVMQVATALEHAASNQGFR